MASSNVMLKRHGLLCTFNELKSKRIVAVCAPAGYGKTVAVAQWLDKDVRAKAIFSLDEYDNRLCGFCERFCAALRICQPQNQTLNEIISHPTFQNAPDEFTLRAVAALSSRKRTVLAIDDLHLIDNYMVLRFLFVLIKRLPNNFQIILISRHEMPPDFSELWLKEQVASVKAKQLLFSDDEVRALYNKRGSPITMAQAQCINKQAHGWAIGIKASLLSGEEPFDKAYGYMDNFVRKNIWAKWDNITREFMLRTAFLSELTPSLCEAMTGLPNSDKVLKELVQKGTFITQTQKGVYRYHHLFQQILRRIAEERGESFLTSLLEAEGRWHLSQKDFYSATECFIQCKNHDGIEQCYSLLSANTYIVAKRLLPILKHSEFIAAAKKYPHLLYLAAYGAFAEGYIDDATSFIDEYYARYLEIVQRHPNLVHNIHYMRLLDFRLSLNQVMNQITVPDDLSNITLPIWRISMHMPLMHRGINNLSDLAIGDVIANVNSNFSSKIGWLYGTRFAVDKEVVTAGLLYEQGNLDVAYEYALKAYAMLEHHPFPDTKNCAMMILVYILDALGEKECADTVIKYLSQMIEKDKAYHLYDNFEALIIRRKIVAGDIMATESWLAAKTNDSHPPRKIYIALTTCRALIAIKKYETAIIMLKKVLEMVSTLNRGPDAIEVHILLTVSYWKKKGRFQKKALEHLDEATSMAYPYDFAQMFVNNGPEISCALYKLQKSAEQRKSKNIEQVNFIKKLYLKIQSNPNFELDHELKDTSIKFTDRQSSILQLLCQGKTHKEIAEILGIKPPSVSTHIRRIYNKLDVANISEAVKRVSALGLLE